MIGMYLDLAPPGGKRRPDRCVDERDHIRPNLVSLKPPNETGTTQTAGEGGKEAKKKNKDRKIVIEI